MSEIVCTICSKEKRGDPGLTPAIRRYRNRRIKHVHRRSLRMGLPFRILSGKFGLLRPEQPIPHYDCRLMSDTGDNPVKRQTLEEMADYVAGQLREEAVSKVIFFMRPKGTKGWEPYCRVLQEACNRAGARLEPRVLEKRAVFHGVAGLVLLALLAVYLCLDVRDFLLQPPLVGPASRFEGPIQRVADGSFVIRGEVGRPSVAHTAVRPTPHAVYFLEIEVTGSPKVGVDLYAGPEYDFDEQEGTLPAGEKNGLRTRLLRSGNAPAQAQLRIFFQDPRDVRVDWVRLYLVKESFRFVQFLLAGLSLLAVGGLALRSRSPTWLGALALGIAAFLVYRLAEPAVSDNLGDNFWYVPSSVSLIQDGDLDLAEYIPYGLGAGDYRIAESGGRLYNFFPLGTTLTAVPIVVAAMQAGGDEHPLDFALRLSSLTAAASAAVAAALLYVLLCGLTGQGKALFLTALFALASPHFTIHAGSLWSHNALLPFFLWALIALRSENAWTAAIPLSMAVLTRPDFLPAAALSLLYVWIWQPRQGRRLAIASGAAAGLLTVLSLALHQWAVPPYYQLGPRLSLERFPEALLGHLISPNRGLFVFAPIFLGSIWGLWLGLRRRGGEAPFYGLLGAMTVAHWAVISLFVHWWGGHCYGPRLFSPMLPALVVLLVPALERWESMSGSRRIGFGSLAAVLVAWSLFVQIRGVTDPQVQRWNSTPNIDAHPDRVWDWKDWQILRDFTPPP